MASEYAQKPQRPSEKALADVVAAEAQRCEADPNVACVGFGLKFVKGRPTLRAAVQYHVYRKLATPDEIRAAGSQPVLPKVEGYDTDVLEWTIDRPANCPGSKPPTGERGGRKEDPLIGGTSTTVLGDFFSFPTGYGTLGGICFDASSGDAMALSNAHVYGDDIGNDAIQPWLPGSEYLEASLKYLFCGGPVSHLFFWTAPSPLTTILTTAAAAAWTAAIASDAEDPSRWAQRTGPVPAAGVQTQRERVHLEANIPYLPFPGRQWESKTSWQVTRVTTAGETSVSTTDNRPNEHVLVGKRVFTDREVYRGGDRVTICAQLFFPVDNTPPDRFVVAHCVPLSDPERIVRRVLVPDHGPCLKYDQQREPVCLRGFEPQAPGLTQMSFRVKAGSFVLFSDADSTTLLPASAPDNPSGVNALRIPTPASLKIACPPSTYVALQVFHLNQPIRAVAISANGTQVATATSTPQRGVMQVLELTGLEIVRVEVEGGGGEGYLAGICVDKRQIDVGSHRVRGRYYTGELTLARNEPPGKWGIVVVSQTLDNTPTGGDPVAAATRLGGIVDSANVVETGECACTILFDATFDVA